MTKVKIPWVMRLPRGVREQPSQVFIGVMVFISGLSFMFGFSTSSVRVVIGDLALHIWGAVFAASGAIVVMSTGRAMPALEKLGLRILSLTIFAYSGWLLTLVDFEHTGVSVLLSVILAGICEIRIAFLKILLRADISHLIQQSGVMPNDP